MTPRELTVKFNKLSEAITALHNTGAQNTSRIISLESKLAHAKDRIAKMENGLNPSVKKILEKIPDLEKPIPKLQSRAQRLKNYFKHKFSNSRHYESNLTRSKFGPSILSGNMLLIKVRDADSIILKLTRDNKIIQVDQSHKNDEDKDPSTANLLLKRKYKGVTENLPTGKYKLFIWYYSSGTGRTGNYKHDFYIL